MNSNISGSATAKNIYHEDDKEGLRIFLCQRSAKGKKTNGERLGLKISDIESWQTNEEWVAKIKGLTWSGKSPKSVLWLFQR